jgi:hypothetical protein
MSTTEATTALSPHQQPPPPDSNENILATITNHPSNNVDPNTATQEQNYSAPAPPSTSTESHPTGTISSLTHAANTTLTSKQPPSTVPKPSSTEEPNPNPTPNQTSAIAASTQPQLPRGANSAPTVNYQLTMLKSPDVQIKVLNMTQGLQQNPNLEKL